MRAVLILLRRALLSMSRDGCFGIAKGAAYSGLLSLFPFLSSIAALLVQANALRVSEYLARFFFEIVPPGAADLIQRQFRVSGTESASFIVGSTLLSIWAASSLIETLMEGFRAAYRIPQGRGMVQDRLVAIGLVFISAAPAATASMLLLFGDRMEAWLNSAHTGFQAEISLLGRVVRFLVALGAIVATTLLLYYIGPNRPQKWKHVWPGAVIATVLWLAVTALFAWYVRNLANYNVMYGGIGGVVALMVWMYLLSAIALFGCEYNAQLERLISRH
jgi:membrane protein